MKNLLSDLYKMGLGPGLEPGTYGSTALRYITKTNVN